MLSLGALILQETADKSEKTKAYASQIGEKGKKLFNFGSVAAFRLLHFAKTYVIIIP